MLIFSARAPVTLIEVLAELPPLQLQFFEALDRELIKVQNFYREREKDAIIRSAIIREQLNELKDHRRIFHVSELSHIRSITCLMLYNRPMRTSRVHLSCPVRLASLRHTYHLRRSLGNHVEMRHQYIPTLFLPLAVEQKTLNSLGGSIRTSIKTRRRN